jgi:hypothetical protein
MKRLFVILISLVLLTGAASSVQAIPLQDLFDGGSILVDDKLFSGWTLFNMESTDPAFDPDFSLIEVTGLDDDPMNPGIRIEPNGQLQVQDFNFVDVFFGFTVDVLDPQYVIKDASLAFGGGIGRDSDLGDPGIAIYEGIYDPGFNPLAALAQEFTFNPGDISIPSADFAPQSQIFVLHRAAVFTGGSA